MGQLKIVGAVLIVLVIALILYGGDFIYSREFTSITPHMGKFSAEDQGLSADNYGQLKAQILTLIKQAKTTGDIRLYDYMTDVELDLPRACHEIITEEPLGAYAVDNITIEQSKILSYYDVKVNIKYSRPRAEVHGIKTAETLEDFDAILRDTMLGFEKQCAVLINYYADEIYEPEQSKERISLSFPDALYGDSKMKIEFFPETGIHRILLLTFEYSEEKEKLQSKRVMANTRIAEVAESQDDKDEREKTRYFFEYTYGSADYIESAQSGAGFSADMQTPYGILFNNRGVSLGFAATFNKLCKEAGTKCIIIKGKYKGNLHYWNMVYTQNSWYHVDAALQSNDKKGDYFLLQNSEMSDYYWDIMEFELY